MEDLKLGRISMVAPGHAQIAEKELRKEGQVKPDEGNDRRHLTQELGIKPPGNLRPPVMHPAHESHHHSSHHDVMKMSHDKVGIGHMHIDRQRCEKKSSQSSNGEKPDKTERVEHG